MDTEVRVEHYFMPKGYVKVTRLPAGTGMRQDENSVGSVGALLSGKAVLHAGDKQILMEGPDMIGIQPGVMHSLEATTDVLWACIFDEV